MRKLTGKWMEPGESSIKHKDGGNLVYEKSTQNQGRSKLLKMWPQSNWPAIQRKSVEGVGCLYSNFSCLKSCVAVWNGVESSKAKKNWLYKRDIQVTILFVLHTLRYSRKCKNKWMPFEIIQLITTPHQHLAGSWFFLPLTLWIGVKTSMDLQKW